MKKVVKRRKIKKTPIILLILCGVLLGVSLFFFTWPAKTMKETTEQEPVETPVPTPSRVETSFSLIMVGDALIHEAVYMDVKNEDYDFKPMLENIKPFVSSYDVAYYNQETILGGLEIGLSTYPRFNSPYTVGDAFVDAGFNLVSLSTNHTLDRGEQAILNSRNYWNNQENVLASGSYSSFEERNTPVIKEVNGITYTMLSYTTTTNGLRIPEGKDYLLNVYDAETVKNDIEAVRDKVDVLMVSMHWGTEYSFGVSEEQREIATYLSSLGVDLIIGTHPHVVEPIEFIDDTMVVYSLGNFISAQRGVERLTGGVASVTFKKVTENGETTVTLENPACNLVYTYSKGTSSTGRYDFKLYWYSQLNESLLPSYETYYNKYMNVLKGSDERLSVLTYPE